ncbi:MAG: carbamoyl phosphate synthase large subunit, partial [Candidatus Margulisiibacteriota bacterium]
IPQKGTIFLSLKDADKPGILEVAQLLLDLGFKLLATKVTADYLCKQGLAVEEVKKVGHGRPDIVDAIINNEVQLIINTPSGKNPLKDEMIIRQSALKLNVPVVTTLSGALATAKAIKEYLKRKIEVKPIQEFY